MNDLVTTMANQRFDDLAVAEKDQRWHAGRGSADGIESTEDQLARQRIAAERVDGYADSNALC